MDRDRTRRQTLLPPIEPYGGSSETPAQAKARFEGIMGTLHLVRGIVVLGPTNKDVDSATIIGAQEDNDWARRRLEELGPSDAAVLNNKACAAMWLHQWGAATSALAAALNPTMRDVAGPDGSARDAARYNQDVLSHAKAAYALCTSSPSSG